MSESSQTEHDPIQPRVLVVDDSLAFRRELCETLMMEGFTVVGEAANGFQAIELAENLQPDLILMDQNMPALTGIEATRRIKASMPRVRVIFVAAEANWRESAIRAGAEEYFVKGDDLQALFEAIRSPAASPGRENDKSIGPRFWRRKSMPGWLAALGVLLITAMLLQFPALALPALVLTLALMGLGLLARSLLRLASRESDPVPTDEVHPRNPGERRRPSVTIHLPTQGDQFDFDRMLAVWTELDWDNYGVVVPAKLVNGNIEALRDEWGVHPRVKFSRSAPGKALLGTSRVSLIRNDPRVEVVAEFDPEFVPPADIIARFIPD